ncbi:MAG: hypothetical protein K8H74_13060 [Notoacmeibacter sp.]|nr:hypothetical protein [Notoacmeibacter sp.]
MEFELHGDESIEVFDGSLVRARDKAVLYRIAVTHFDGANLKIITNGKSKLITPDARSRAIDVVVAGSLFLEADGGGSITGTFEALFGL